jgi:hypothetical protein
VISEEKMVHIVHLMIDGIWKQDLVDYPDEDEALREAKRIGVHYVAQMNSIVDLVRKRILGQKNPPLENSPQWDVLYQKYFEEEARKKGG